ncbi:AraC-type DNA-binding protein [Flavobacterium segetis]|uniref:AraC-type DNA-binding protein n=1 Tax=Flavobacterium segetis TaxID=271157 RepID=A0A1M5IEP5_9FLAO|nr:AraC family transcriptional regulator [Flavobacterium segetis]SHG26731.1 AraC-type DNA-binding protein [Flavobacterium segetis]
MDGIYDQKRIVSVHQMLFDMASGNFNTRIPQSKQDDELETIVVLINMVAEEIKDSLSDFINTHSTPEFITSISLVVNAYYFITSFTLELLLFLGYSESELLDQPLATIITPASLEQIQSLFESGVSKPTILSIDFINKAQLTFTVSCNVGQMLPRSEIIFIFAISKNCDYNNPLFEETHHKKQIKSRKVDAFLIQQLYDYILAHLDSPLPSIQLLARKFGTNEYKLKAGFRHFFKTSIYKFYNQERLKKAYFMIQHTTKSLKNISVMIGFTTYSNFSKSFKKHYGFSPFEVQRNQNNITLSTELPHYDR